MLLILALVVLLTTLFCETAARRSWLPYWVTRKVLHVVAVGACAVAVYYADTIGYDHRQLLIYLVAGAEIALLILISLGSLMREESGRKPWGIVWFPLAFLILLLTVKDAEYIAYFMAILAVCDPAATIAGKLFRPALNHSILLDDKVLRPTAPTRFSLTRPYSLTGDPKTAIGNIAFFASFLVLTVFFPAVDFTWGADAAFPFPNYLFRFHSIPWIICAGILLTAGEAIGSKGLDNLIIPLLGALLFIGFYWEAEPIVTFLLMVPAAIAFCFFTVRRKSLSPGGAVAASLLGIVVALHTGPIWLLPLVIFFGSSSLIGKIFPGKSSAGDAKQKQPRDATQVLANGAVYGLVAISSSFINQPSAHQLPEFPVAYLLLVAAAIATADTWSSEIGQYFGRPTYDLVKWRRVPAGLSGGVSWPGTLAGLAGAAFLTGTCWWLLPYADLWSVAAITLAGFLGMLLDSVLGSLLQATYRDPATGALSDVPSPTSELASGFRWMTNDLVNFLAILLGVLLFGYLIV